VYYWPGQLADEPAATWQLVGDIYPDAISDGQTYGRKDGAWVTVNPPAKASATIMDPELVFAASPAVPLLSVEATWAPNGIQLRNVYLKTDAASTYSLGIERWSSPTTLVSNLATVATAAGSEASVVPTANTIPAGDMVFLRLPGTDAKWIQPTVIYTVVP
jgi:hypothetical protein